MSCDPLSEYQAVPLSSRKGRTRMRRKGQVENSKRRTNTLQQTWKVIIRKGGGKMCARRGKMFAGELT